MNRQSYLDSGLLKSECTECIELLNSDISEMEYASNNVKMVISESSIRGETMEAYKLQLEKYSEIFGLIVEADKLDIKDYTFLMNRVSKSYDGDLICSSYDRAKKDRDDYQSKANHNRQLASTFNTVVETILPGGEVLIEYISNPFEASAKMYQDMANDCQVEMNLWQAKKNEFDAIEADTMRLFLTGEGVRSRARVKLLGLNKKLIPTNPTPSIIGGLGAITIEEFVRKLLIKMLVEKPKLIDPDWLDGHGAKYGLTETEIKYLEEYYPGLVNQLYGVTQSGNPSYIANVTADIHSVLRDDYVYMMEMYGYSYEAISYLHENNPGLMAALDSHYGPASMPDARRAIYDYLHPLDICVYDPDYDFDSYNMNRDYIDSWNFRSEVQYHTNCYAFAFGLTYDPRTGEKLPEHGLQPGYFSGQKYNTDIAFSKADHGKTLVGVIQKDAEVLDLNFQPYEEGMTGGVRVVLVIKPNDDNLNVDYHWYYYDEEAGKWYNKQGVAEATDKDIDWDSRDYFDGELDDNQGAYYDDYYGPLEYNYGEEIGSTYEDVIKHAESMGYTVVAKENENDKNKGFYITRQDGGEFQ